MTNTESTPIFTHLLAELDDERTQVILNPREKWDFASADSCVRAKVKETLDKRDLKKKINSINNAGRPRRTPAQKVTPIKKKSGVSS